MAELTEKILFKCMSQLFKAHPWHGINIGDKAPKLINAYIEMVPTDTVKYEANKQNGHLRVDRPQKYSSQCPSLYGFIPQTYCGKKNGEFCSLRVQREGIAGDGDPLDICVITERPIMHGDVLVRAVPIGGLRMIDSSQADDKIVAVLHEDPAYGNWKDISDCPPQILERLRQRHDRIADTDFLPGALRMVIAFQEGFLRDPLLPPELLPRPWPGREARELVNRGRRLGVLARERHERPALFSLFEEVIDRL